MFYNKKKKSFDKKKKFSHTWPWQNLVTIKIILALKTARYLILKLTSLVGECRRRRSRNQFSEDAVKSDFEEVCQGPTYPAVFVDVTQDVAKVGELWDDQLVLESLRDQWEVNFNSPDEIISHASHKKFRVLLSGKEKN